MGMADKVDNAGAGRLAQRIISGVVLKSCGHHEPVTGYGSRGKRCGVG